MADEKDSKWQCYIIPDLATWTGAAGSKPYTGGAQQSDLADNDVYSVTQGDDWVNAGEYDVVLELADADNYRWANADGAEVTVIFTITQAENAFTQLPSIENWTYGEGSNAPGGAQALFGNDTIVYMYAAEANGEYTTEVPANAGVYYVKAFVAATGNYAGAESDAVEFEIYAVADRVRRSAVPLCGASRGFHGNRLQYDHRLDGCNADRGRKVCDLCVCGRHGKLQRRRSLRGV